AGSTISGPAPAKSVPTTWRKWSPDKAEATSVTRYRQDKGHGVLRVHQGLRGQDAGDRLQLPPSSVRPALLLAARTRNTWSGVNVARCCSTRSDPRSS